MPVAFGSFASADSHLPKFNIKPSTGYGLLQKPFKNKFTTCSNIHIQNSLSTAYCVYFQGGDIWGVLLYVLDEKWWPILLFLPLCVRLLLTSYIYENYKTIVVYFWCIVFFTVLFPFFCNDIILISHNQETLFCK